MKTILKISILFLLFSLIGAGCKKEKIGYDPNSIIGKWEWIYSVGGDLTASYSYPQKGQILTIEFEKDSDLIFKENGKTYNETIFSISKDTISYSIDNNVEHIYLFKLGRDTLTLSNPFTLGDFSVYKRIN